MTIEKALERMQGIIEGFSGDVDHESDLIALTMVRHALKNWKRWISCSERLPELHKEEFDGDTFQASDRLLFSSSTGVHCGYCENFNGGLMWETEEGLSCDGVTAWMPLPEPYSFGNIEK